MRNLLLGVLVACGLFMSIGAGRPESVSEVGPSGKRLLPLRVADLTLDRLQRIPFSMTFATVSVPFPPTYGLVVDQFQMIGGNPNQWAMGVNVNGVNWGSYPISGSSGGPTYEPALLARPGDVVTLSLQYTGTVAPSTPVEILLTGWQVYPGEV